MNDAGPWGDPDSEILGDFRGKLSPPFTGGGS